MSAEKNIGAVCAYLAYSATREQAMADFKNNGSIEKASGRLSGGTVGRHSPSPTQGFQVSAVE
jgi:hypothetical protein